MKTKLKHSGFCVLRTPKLPIEDIYKIPVGKLELKYFIMKWIENSDVKESIYLASSSLYDRVENLTKSGIEYFDDKMLVTLVKYYIRMASRPTPFGTFSAVGFLHIGGTESLSLKEKFEFRKEYRLSFSYLNLLKEKIECDTKNLPFMTYRINDTFLNKRDRGFYIDYTTGISGRKYKVSSVEIDDALNCILSIKKEKYTFSDILTSIYNTYPDEDEKNILKYLHQLVKEKVLITDVELPIQSSSPDFDYCNKLIQSLPMSDDLKLLHSSISDLKSISKEEFSFNHVEAVKDKLAAVLGKKHADMFQVDSFVNNERISISSELVTNILEAVPYIELLFPGDNNELNKFVDIFNSMYEGRFIPILEVLNDEFGISQTIEARNSSDLLSGMNLRATKNKKTDFLEESISKLIVDSSIEEIRLENIIINFEGNKPESNLPRSFATMVTVYEGVDEPVVRLHGFYGPSAANLIARFSYLNDSLLKNLKEHLKHEENGQPGVVYAEIVHLPDGKVGNIICRPPLRDYTIDVLSSNKSECSTNISLSEIFVFVKDGKVRLWSSRINKEIIPRLSSAHNYNHNNIGLYRFLCMVQGQSASVPSIRVPAIFSKMGITPRLRFKNLILVPKQWIINRKEFLKDYRELNDLNELIKKYSLDRFVCIGDGDNILTIDLANPNTFSILISETKNKNNIVFIESLDTNAQSSLEVNDRKFSHEVIIPILNESNAAKSSYISDFPNIITDCNSRYMPPGSEWISFKIYASENFIEEIITSDLSLIVSELSSDNHFESWFYIRYYDTDRHLRLRFKIADESQLLCVIKKCNAYFQNKLESRLISKIEIFTYEREIERYGGVQAMHLAERMFMYDSNAAIYILKGVQKYGENYRLRCLVVVLDTIMRSFGLTLSERFNFVTLLREGFAVEFNDSKRNRKLVGDVFNRYKLEILNDLSEMSCKSESDEIGRGILYLKQSYEKEIESYTNLYFELKKSSLLTTDINIIISSLMHMSCNRVFKIRSREHEFVTYDIMRRCYASLVHNRGASVK